MRVQYQPAAIQARRSAAVAPRRRLPDDDELARPHAPTARRPRLATLLLVVGVLLGIMLLGWMLLTLLVSWWGRVQDDWHYGTPRVERLTAVVGHADSAAHPSLFFALNDDGRAQVIECPGGDCSHARAYLPPILITGDQGETPVTLTLKDVSGDGALDLLIHVEEQTFVYLNDQGVFRPVTDKDHVTV